MTRKMLEAVSEVCPTHFEQPALATLFEYWRQKCAGRIMPSRAEIDPLDLKEHLGWITLLDVFPDFSDFRYRLIGTRVARYFGIDATGQTISEAFELYGISAVKGVLAIHRKVARDHVPMRAYGGAAWLREEHDRFDAIYLPLSNDGETVNMILSAFTFDYQTVQAKSASVLP